ncbi:MAG: class I tRNA ligase family protein [Anaerolineae bacterium]|nr:class I tRNA ligase family protein [Anaerolineae bacterium]
MFKDVPTKVDFVAQEHDVLRFWKETDAFNKLVALRANGPRWSFIDGPITANNPMGVHHGWGRTYKDVFHRYWAMRGYRTRYQNGFDCQGLWVEVEVERELGFRSKQDIEAYGMASFVRRCKERVLRFAAVQTEQSIRLGYWMDWNDPQMLRELADRLAEDPEAVVTVPGPQGPVTDSVERIVARLGLPELGGSYFTLSDENNYMIWTFLKRCWERGWLYKHADVMPWCPRCATGISQHEIATDGYVEMTHPGVTLRFPLRGRPGEALLVWTTTPWTLTSNIAVAVGPDLDYVRVRQGDEVFYLSRGTVGMLRGDYEVLAELKGREMEGWAYDGPFDELPAQQQPGGLTELESLIEGIEVTAAEAHRIILWDGVGEAEGTGIVHIATGCGAEDFQLGLEHRLPIVVPLDNEGIFVDGFGWLTGRPVAEVAQPIFEDLRRKGLLYSVDDYTHRYPVCWRCGTELVFRLVDEWFISMDELRYDIMEVTRQIRWIPTFGLERELDWLRNMHDWMISKKRYWGLALPIWECQECGHFEVIGDEHELRARAVAGWEEFAGHTPHRPWIDAVKIRCSHCGATVSRIADVGNPWLDAGIVSFSTLRYRSDPDYWRTWYPADWISESFPGQFRNWFYSLLAMATVLDNSPPFRSCFGYATLLAEDGRPMHKSWGNAIEFNEAADRMGVDVMRWLYCAHKPENDLLFGYTRADEVRRQFLIPLWNVYSFFVTYANVDKWTPDREGPGGEPVRPLSSLGLLDRWILARLHQVVSEVTARLADYDAYRATMAVEAFLDDLSNWYVRRSRRRFWKSEADEDKAAAYRTLYHVLVTLCRLLAPFVPFVTEAMYQNLVRSVDADAPESVHHCDWPAVDEALLDEALVADMALAKQVASLGRAARASADIKLRQPLARATVFVPAGERAGLERLADLVADELNVKELTFAGRETELVDSRLLPDNKRLGPRFGRQFPQVRQALAAMDPAVAVAELRAGRPLLLTVNGETVELTAEEVLVLTEPRAGLAVAAEGGVTVAVDTRIDEALRAEGLARELVRRLQNLRKEAGFELEDRITTYALGGPVLREVLEHFGDYVAAETLSVALVAGEPPADSAQVTFPLDGEAVTVGVVRRA